MSCRAHCVTLLIFYKMPPFEWAGPTKISIDGGSDIMIAISAMYIITTVRTIYFFVVGIKQRRILSSGFDKPQ